MSLRTDLKKGRLQKKEESHRNPQDHMTTHALECKRRGHYRTENVSEDIA